MLDSPLLSSTLSVRPSGDTVKWLVKLWRSGKTSGWDLLSSNSILADTVGASTIAVFRLG